MTELTKVLLTSATTILGGVIIFVVGQLLSKFIFDPIQELKKLFGKVRYSLIYYGVEIITPVEGDEDKCKVASNEFRKLSSDITALAESIPFYSFCAKISDGFIPPYPKVTEAASELIGLSNSVFGRDRSGNWDRQKKIESCLFNR